MNVVRTSFVTGLLLAMPLLMVPAEVMGDPSSALHPAQYRGGNQGEVPLQPWWMLLQNAELSALVAEGLSANRDLEAAIGRVVQADGLALQALAGLLPSVTLTVSGSMLPCDPTSPTSTINFCQLLVPEDPPETYFSGAATIAARYGVDLFGRQALSFRAARLASLASQGDRDGVALSLAQQIVEAWLDAIASGVQIQVLETQIESNERLLELIQLRFERGEATGLEVLQQRQQLAQLRSQLPSARSTRRLLELRLGVLLGRPAQRPLDLATTQLPGLPPPPGTGTPEGLVRQRPQLRAAAARARAAQARQKGALRTYAPALNLSGQVGVNGVYIEAYDSANAWSAGAELSIPLFRGGATVGAVQAARGEKRAADAALEQALLQAVSEVESALAREAEVGAQVKAVIELEEAARQAFEESRSRYVAGLVNYLSVLTSLNAHQAAQLSLVQVRRAELGARIQLYQALGGVWTRDIGLD